MFPDSFTMYHRNILEPIAFKVLAALSHLSQYSAVHFALGTTVSRLATVSVIFPTQRYKVIHIPQNDTSKITWMDSSQPQTQFLAPVCICILVTFLFRCALPFYCCQDDKRQSYRNSAEKKFPSNCLYTNLRTF